MWEPFNERARHAIVRAQEVAQMFGSNFIGTEHLAFALAETDDDVGRILSGTIGRDALRERLGGASRMPQTEMIFTAGSKRSIELAFEHARRLNHRFIDSAHLALGMLDAQDDLPIAPGVDLRAVHVELGEAARADSVVRSRWTQTAGPPEPHAAANALLSVLRVYPQLGPAGTRVSLTIERPGEEPLSWTWTASTENEPS